MSINTSSNFVEAVKRGDLASASAMIELDPKLANTAYDRATPLHFAALENQREIVDLLIRAGADVNARDDKFNMTPIRWANEKGHTEMVQFLLDRGAQVDLYAAVAFGLTERVNDLLQKDPVKIDAANHYGTPIHEASLWGHVELVRLLLEHGANPAFPNTHGDNALEIARKQVASNCSATPIVTDKRRKEIKDGCRAVIEILSTGPE